MYEKIYIYNNKHIFSDVLYFKIKTKYIYIKYMNKNIFTHTHFWHNGKKEENIA